MNSYEFVNKVRSMNLSILTPLDVSRIAQISLSSAYVFLNRLNHAGKIYPILKGKYALTQDIFAIASNLIYPAYLSFSTALYLHGQFSQVIERLYLVSTRKHRSPVTIMETPIQVIRLQPHHLFGYRKIPKENGEVLVADLEKALVDGLYLPQYLAIGEIARILKEKQIDLMVFEDYLKRMQSEVVIRRAGFLLDLYEYTHHLKCGTITPYRLNPQNKSQGTYNSKWHLYINEEV